MVNPRNLLRVLVAALLAGGALVVGTSVGAVPEVRTYALTGSMTIGGTFMPIPGGSTFTATVETTTGAFTDGSFSMPTFPVPGVATPTDITLGNVGAITGTIDPAGGVSTGNITLSVTITVPSTATVCVVTPITFVASTANPGGSPFTGSPQSGTETAAGFNVPAVPTGGAAPCDPAAANAVNTNLGLPTSSSSVTLTAVLAVPRAITKPPGFTG